MIHFPFYIYIYYTSLVIQLLICCWPSIVSPGFSRTLRFKLWKSLRPLAAPWMNHKCHVYGHTFNGIKDAQHIWAMLKTSLFIFSKRVALRACGVSKNVVGVSPRKLFWIISVRKFLAQGHTCSVPTWAHVMICTILAMEIDSQSQSSWRTMAGAYHRFFDFVAKYWFVTYGGSQFCMAFPFVQSILFKGNFGLSVSKDPWKVCQLIRMILKNLKRLKRMSKCLLGKMYQKGFFIATLNCRIVSCILMLNSSGWPSEFDRT